MDHRRIAAEWSRLLDGFFSARAGEFERAVAACVGALKTGKKILAFGNGGSAAEAQHFTAELVNKFLKPRPALRAVTLSTDTSVLTCIGNDVSYDAHLDSGRFQQRHRQYERGHHPGSPGGGHRIVILGAEPFRSRPPDSGAWGIEV